MSEKVREVFLEVIFKLIVEELLGACQMEKSRQSVTWSEKAELQKWQSVFLVCLFVCLFVPAVFQKGFKVVYVPVPQMLEWPEMRLKDG